MGCFVVIMRITSECHHSLLGGFCFIFLITGEVCNPVHAKSYSKEGKI